MKIKVALADDHSLFLQGMYALLSPIENLEVIIKAENGQLLLNELKKQEVKPDIVLLDLKMPVLDGIETLKKLKEDYPEIKVIVLSMHQDEKFILHLIEMDANGYLVKNSSIKEVLKAINTVMEKGYYYDDFLADTMRKGLLNKNRKKVQLNEHLNLNERELQILDLICQQYTATEIADKLYLSKRTIEGYKKNLLSKMGVRNSVGLIVYCIKHKIIEV